MRSVRCTPTRLLAMSRHIRTNLPPALRRDRRWSTCAVVGSAGSLLMQSHGGAIDRADAVFRVNAAPTRGYEYQVGARTTLRFLGFLPNSTAPPVEVGESVAVYCSPFRHHKCWMLDVLNDSRPRVHPLVWHELRAQIRAAAQKTGRRSRADSRAAVGSGEDELYPTTGAVALFAALRLCDEVNIFGFGNGSWDCENPGARICAKYSSLPVRLRAGCRKWASLGLERYVSEVTRDSHELVLEWVWIEHLKQQGRVRTPQCGAAAVGRPRSVAARSARGRIRSGEPGRKQTSFDR